jgi:hypothetical protein
VNIDWIIPCRYAEVHDNLATIVGAGIDTWWLPDLPQTVQVGVAMRLLASADELGPDHDHTVRNIVRDPAGNTLSDLAETFNAGSVEQADRARADWLNGMAFVTIIQFQATDEGTYTFELIVDSSSKSVPFHVVHGLPPGVAQPEE